jgi:hypothetical protein
MQNSGNHKLSNGDVSQFLTKRYYHNGGNALRLESGIDTFWTKVVQNGLSAKKMPSLKQVQDHGKEVGFEHKLLKLQ